MRLPLTLTAMLLSASAAYAQAPAAAPATSPPPIPAAMPFDIPYGAPISLDQAHKAVAGAAAEAKTRNWKFAISIVDPSGNLIAHATLDGTQ